MELLAAAIVFAVVLNLVDRNRKWGAFWKLCGFACIPVVIFFVWLIWPTHPSGPHVSKLHEDVEWYVSTYGSCPGTERPDWSLDNPCPNSVIDDSAARLQQASARH